MLEKKQILDVCYEVYKVKTDYRTTCELTNEAWAAVGLHACNLELTERDIKTIAFYLENANRFQEILDLAKRANEFHKGEGRPIGLVI
jgi:hypothetical protein